ncbi:MAG: SNF2-related protein [Chloroflexi bacterium]|nr:SNF2-related protein [Chloroflexota bacterium]
MIALHAVWDSGANPGLLVWAESSEARPARWRRGAGRRGAEQPPHPFAATDVVILRAVESIAPADVAEQAAPELILLSLPSAGAPCAPLPSPELILDAGQRPVASQAELRAWLTPALHLDPASSLDLLLALPLQPPGGVDGGPALAFGSSLRFWAEAAKFALELATRQSFAPTVEPAGAGDYRAAWHATLIGPDEEHSTALARAMPPICRALGPHVDEPTAPPSAATLLEDFLNRTVDALARGALAAAKWPARTRKRRGEPLPQQWLHALAGDDGTLDGDPDEVEAFAGEVRSWLKTITPAAQRAPFRACFQLAEPQEEEPDWRIGFYLQANDDRSLLVPADRVWKERSSTLTFLKRKFENPQERLLEDLGRASRLFPLLENSLNTARPGGMRLHAEQAYAFLRESAPLLEQSGFGVLLPAWWQKPSARLGVRLQLRPKQGPRVGQNLMGQAAIVSYQWQIALGDQALSFEEFQALANLKVPLVQVRGQWVELQRDEIERAIAFFKKKHGQGDMALGEALRIGLGQEVSEAGLPVVDVAGEDWVGDFLKRLTDHATMPAAEPPPSFNGQLRPYQLRGLAWLAYLRQYGLGACLADDMGLGKCVAPETLIYVNGVLETAERVWEHNAAETDFDGEGYWAIPRQALVTNSLDPITGKLTKSCIHRLYRQWVNEPLRKITLEDGSRITITRKHQLLTSHGWSSDLNVGDYVCVPSRLIWDGEPGDSGEQLRDYSRLPRSKWTAGTLDQYAHLDIAEVASYKQNIEHLIEQDVFYCKIKSIEQVDYQGWVYDFEVGHYHNFVANGILCHNTVQLIALLLKDLEEQEQRVPTLLICPMSIVGNWQRELQRFAPSLRVMVHHGAERLSGQAFEEQVNQSDVVLTTYSLVHRDEAHLARISWDCVVLDEAQNIKNPSAKQTQAIRRLNAAHRIALTGTPVENRLSELWSIMDFLNHGYLGSAREFHTRFAHPIERYRDPGQAATLKRLIQPLVLRRLKTDQSIITDLPEKMEMKVLCNLTPEQATLYEAVVKDMLKKIESSEGIERRGLVLATLMKLKQVCNHPAHFLSDGSTLPGRSGKLARLGEMLEEALAAGDKALIFTQFAEMGTLLHNHLQDQLGREVLFLHGGTSKKQRDEMVQRFQAGVDGGRYGPALFILSIKAGGVGLNLTAANRVFHFDRWWNPAVENQATDRAFRIGQQKNVQVHKFVCVGTLEERIDAMIEQKKDLAERIVGTGEGWLTEMSTDQLRDLFALSREAVGV